MPDHGDPAAVQAPAEPRNGRLDLVEVVEDVVHVLSAGPPEQRSLGAVRIEAQRLRVQVGGLDHDEAVSGVEVDERAVATQRGEIVRVPMAVREEDEGEFAPRRGHGHAHLQIHVATRH